MFCSGLNKRPIRRLVTVINNFLVDKFREGKVDWGFAALSSSWGCSSLMVLADSLLVRWNGRHLSVHSHLNFVFLFSGGSTRESNSKAWTGVANSSRKPSQSSGWCKMSEFHVTQMKPCTCCVHLIALAFTRAHSFWAYSTLRLGYTVFAMVRASFCNSFCDLSHNDVAR